MKVCRKIALYVRIDANRHVPLLVIAGALLVKLHLAARVPIARLVADLHSLPPCLSRLYLRVPHEVSGCSALQKTSLHAVDTKEEYREEAEEHSIRAGYFLSA